MHEASKNEDSGSAASADSKSTSDEFAAAARRRELKGPRQDARGPSLKLRDGLRVEEIDDELVVLDASGEAVHRVTADGVAAVRLLEGGVAESEIPTHLVEAVKALGDAGLVSGSRRLSRRKAMAVGGAAWAAATVTTFALADPAAAWSVCKNGKTPTNPQAMKYTTAGTSTWTSGPSGFHTPNTQRSYNVLVRAWGGGGSGGVDGWTLGGGGGGGGAYAHSTISVLECTEFTVDVGAGGAASTYDGNNGSPSTFKDDTTLKATGGARGTAGRYGDAGDGGQGGTTAASVGTTKYAGGNGGDGGVADDTACGGGSAGSAGNGGNGSAGSAGGGGAGTPGGASGGTKNNPGSAPGGGGGGGDSTSGKGADGAVWVGV